MSNELSGLELRKAALFAVGWKFGLRDDCAPNYPDGNLGNCWWSPRGIPFYESEPELQIDSSSGIAMDALVEFCGKNGWDWWAGSRRNGAFACGITTPGTIVDNPVIGQATGSTPAEAICRAIIAAKEQS